MSTTRLLVLGVVRIFQPVHGYIVRRELMSWRLDDWVNLQPGSIYSQLKTLERDLLISVSGQSKADGRPERTEYSLTAEGEKVFQQLLRRQWWQVEHGNEPLVAALTLMPFMPRAEMIDALQSRVHQLEAQVVEMRYSRAQIRDGATGADGDVPEHVREIFDFVTIRLKSDIEWTKQFLKRLRDGLYVFADEHDRGH